MSVEKTCPICGTVFSCQGDTSCWCAALPILERVDRSDDCYCPNCLQEKLHKQPR